VVETKGWKIWGSALCEILRFLQPPEVNRCMEICKNFAREAERNRVWRPLVEKYYRGKISSKRVAFSCLNSLLNGTAHEGMNNVSD
jgi:hypothetical protein